MPLPLIPVLLGGGSTIAAIVGGKKGYDAYKDSNEAKKVNNKAKEIVDESQKILNENREYVNKAIKEYAERKIEIFDDYLLPYVDIFSNIKNIDLEDDILQDGDFKVDLKEFKQLKTDVLNMRSLLIGGIAGGTMALGGLVAGPALMAAGWAMASSAEKAKNNAYANLSKARAIEESNNTAMLQLEKVVRLIMSLEETLDDLADYFDDMTDKLRKIVMKNDNYAEYSDKNKEFVHKTLLMAQTIKNLINVPLMDENGEIEKEARKVRVKSEKMLTEMIKADIKFGFRF